MSTSITIDDFEGRPDLSKAVVQVLGTADVQHDLAKINKIMSQHAKFVENQSIKEKKSRTYPLKKRQVAFWRKVEELFCEEFAAEVAAHADPYRLEQCAKKKQARLKKKQVEGPASKKRKSAPASEEEEESEEGSSKVSDDVLEKVNRIRGRA